jgi:hypothetical protein
VSRPSALADVGEDVGDFVGGGVRVWSKTHPKKSNVRTVWRFPLRFPPLFLAESWVEFPRRVKRDANPAAVCTIWHGQCSIPDGDLRLVRKELTSVCLLQVTAWAQGLELMLLLLDRLSVQQSDIMC